MKTLSHLVVLWVVACWSTASVRAEQLLYLASQGDKTIAAFQVDPKTGALTKRSRVKLPGTPGPMTFSPDARFVYAAMTGLDGGRAGVATLHREKDGSLTIVKTATITSRTPYIRTNKQGTLLLAAHYGRGEVTVTRITDGICTGELLDQKKTAHTAHCIELDPSGQFAFVPHTSPNKVYQFRLDAKTGTLTPNQPPTVDGPDADHRYHQPRHYAHHPTLDIAYTSNERGGGITAWKFDPASGTLSEMQTLSTLPPNFEGDSAAADIHLTPNGRFAYVSNRDLTQRTVGAVTQDSLAGFTLDPKTGRMKPIGTFPTTHFPRSFCIDRTGQFLYAAGQRSGKLVAYRIDPATGQLKQLATYDTGGSPIWVMCGESVGTTSPAEHGSK